MNRGGRNDGILRSKSFSRTSFTVSSRVRHDRKSQHHANDDLLMSLRSSFKLKVIIYIYTYVYLSE